MNNPPRTSVPAAVNNLTRYLLTGQDALAVRASKKLRSDELLVLSRAPSS